MAVSIIWSNTNGGSAIGDFVDHGDIDNGSIGDSQEIFVRHDGENPITGVAFYIREYSGTYNGDATAGADFAEMIAWGDENTSNSFGGIMIHWGAASGYVSAWPVYNNKEPAESFTHRTGKGDSFENAVALPTTTGALAAGEIADGSNPNVRFRIRVGVPNNEDKVGVRLFDHVMTYTYTS